MPDIKGRDQYRGDILHSSAYRNGKPFAGKRVLVVGAGNSGSEIAVDLSEHDADTSISIRAGVAFVPRPSSLWMAQHGADVLRALPRRIAGALYRSQWHDARDCGIPWPTGDPLMAYPVVGIDLPNTVRAGRINVRSGVRAMNKAGVIFEDGREEAYDAIVFATGYRPALDFIQRDQLVLDERGWPKLDAQWRSVANRHLYCLGYTYPATEGWLQSIGRFAGEAARAMAQQAG
jgi:cation diffusion facilitator CzcD-associated flavoprotein CzcO